MEAVPGLLQALGSMELTPSNLFCATRRMFTR